MLPDNRRPAPPDWDLLAFGLATAGAVVCVVLALMGVGQ
jgi:hypothetical protein